MQAIPYLFFNGQCAAAFHFYEQCFGGQIVTMITHEQMPATEQVPPDWRDAILHARLVAGDLVLQGSDAPPDRCYDTPQGFFVSLSFDDPAEAERIFQTLAENGSVCMPFAQTFWAYRFGMLTDQFGTPWMINCEQAA